MHKTDLEIASNASKKHITDIAASINIPEEALIVYGNDKAKINYDYLDTCKNNINGKLTGVYRFQRYPDILFLEKDLYRDYDSITQDFWSIFGF